MKIAICGSLDHFQEMNAVRDELMSAGHEVYHPESAEKLIRGEIDSLFVEKHKSDMSADARAKKFQLITTHMRKIKDSDAILVVNLEKKGVANYIGGNTFLEMGFALAYEKPIYLYNPVPEVAYKDEITGMLPIVINQDISLIK